MKVTFSGLALLAMTAAATLAEGAGWQRLTAPEIEEALAGRELIYDNAATQTFAAGGDTVYDAGTPSRGSWRVSDDQYCSVWPPSDRWDCYRVERSQDGVVLRFVSDRGGETLGRYAEAE
jgi:hypothetical protein